MVPGGTLMAIAAAAAFETVTSDFSIDTLHALFLNGPKPDIFLQLRVQRLSDGGRFVTRVVTLEQGSTTMVHVTCSFVRTALMGGGSMTHSARRKTSETIEEITLDDLEPGRNKQGPIMRYQRLPLVYTGKGARPQDPSPLSTVYTSAAQIASTIAESDSKLQSLGIIQLSDYHILDAPPTLHDLSCGPPAIGDISRTPTYNHFERFTSLNHTIRFHIHEGFRADDLCHIEVTSPWTNLRRAEVQSKIFDRHGGLVATCAQEAYYVMKEEKESKL